MCCLRPPDLIIQDELHLINGPLGTLVGLYETAVDNLCNWTLDGKTVRPKVIASSATIRKAPAQVNSLYLRQTNIFPPNGLLVNDNFFSRQRTPDENNPGRCIPGDLCARLTVESSHDPRLCCRAMSAAQYLYEKYGGLVDPYMTLVGYFNAMRDLGGLRRVLDDAIRTRLRQMEKRGLANRYLDTYSISELTSRIGATDIPEILDRLGATFDPARDEERKKKRKSGEKVSSFQLSDRYPAGYQYDLGGRGCATLGFDGCCRAAEIHQRIYSGYQPHWSPLSWPGGNGV